MNQNAQSQSKKKSKPLPSEETENNRTVKFIQYATSRGKTIDYVLQFPILSRPIFLLEKDKLFLKKSKKADLMNILLENLNNCDIIVGDDGRFHGSCKEDNFCPAQEYLHLWLLLQILFEHLAIICSRKQRIENYKELSPKGAERLRRSGGKVGKVCEVVADDRRSTVARLD